MKTTLLNILKISSAVLFCLVTSTASAQVIPFDGAKPLSAFPDADAKRVVLLLSHIHELPTESTFTQTPAAYDILTALATTGDDLIRDNAVIALATYWPSGDLYLLMAKIIASPSSRFATKTRTMIAFGETFKERALPVLKVYLQSADPLMRINAVQAIALSQTDDGVALLKSQMALEESRIVLEAYERFGRQLR